LLMQPGLRAGQKAALADTPCHGDLFHIQQQCQSLTISSLAKRLERLRDGRRLSSRCSKPNSRAGNRLDQADPGSSSRATGCSTRQGCQDTHQWLSHDVLALAGPPLPHRQEFDFIVAELRCREVNGCLHSLLCVALQNNGMTYSPLPRYSMRNWLRLPNGLILALPHSGCLSTA